MNFDMNMLSALMQMFGSMRPSQGAQSSPDQSRGNAPNASDYRDKNTDGIYKNAQVSAMQTEFARNNGIGEKINLNFDGNTDKNDRQNDGQPAQTQGIGGNQSAQNNFFQNLSSQNPMFALLQMMQGAKGSDMSSALMPLIMNMMSPKGGKDMQEKEKNQNSQDKDNGTSASKNDLNKNDVAGNEGCDTPDKNSADKKFSQKFSNDHSRENANKNKKTQTDIFNPIAFAGYELMSALCKLYVTSRRRFDR